MKHFATEHTALLLEKGIQEGYWKFPLSSTALSDTVKECTRVLAATGGLLHT